MIKNIVSFLFPILCLVNEPNGKAEIVLIMHQDLLICSLELIYHDVSMYLFLSAYWYCEIKTKDMYLIQTTRTKQSQLNSEEVLCFKSAVMSKHQNHHIGRQPSITMKWFVIYCVPTFTWGHFTHNINMTDPIRGSSINDRWNPLTKGQWKGRGVMTSSRVYETVLWKYTSKGVQQMDSKQRQSRWHLRTWRQCDRLVTIVTDWHCTETWLT